MFRMLYKLAIISIFLIFNASCALDSGNTGLSPIPLDLRFHGSASQGPDDSRAMAPENIGVDVVTNRKNVLTKNSSLHFALTEHFQR